MNIVYQLTFFLALGLLAIVITIFVFAVAQIGRATESASKDQQDILNKQKEAKKKQIAQIELRLAEAKKAGQLDVVRLSEDMQKGKEEINKFDTQLKRIKERVELIRRKGAVIYPGAAFIIGISLSITASGLHSAQMNLTLALWLWIISLVALVYGIYRVFRTLGAIEQVTVTSQEAIEKLPEAVKLALLEIEEEKKPKLCLIFVEPQPPFHMKASSELTITFRLALSNGHIANNPIVNFLAPPGFEFPDRVEEIPVPSGEYSKYVSCALKTSDIRKPLERQMSLKIKAPSKPDAYKIVYRLYCTEYYSDLIEFDVIVKESDEPPDELPF